LLTNSRRYLKYRFETGAKANINIDDINKAFEILKRLKEDY
jgi:hypothetical protein